MSPLVPLILSFVTLSNAPDAEPARTTSQPTASIEERTIRSDNATTNGTNSSVAAEADARPCHWWQRITGCEKRFDTLPAEVPRSGTVVVVDTDSNQIFLVSNGEIVDKGPAATGSGKQLKRGLREWLFHTPRGRMKVLRKIEDPIWTKPDWAFIEEGKPIPPRDSPKRQVKGHLGKYALDLGDGIMIHGTDDPDSLGKKVSHGCIRVGDELLEKIYQSAAVGTEVYVY